MDFVPVIESFDRDVRVPRNGDDIDLSHRLLDFGSIYVVATLKYVLD